MDDTQEETELINRWRRPRRGRRGSRPAPCRNHHNSKMDSGQARQQARCRIPKALCASIPVAKSLSSESFLVLWL